MSEKASDNVIVIKKNSIIVSGLEEMLNFLEKDWVVEEEIKGDSFIMMKATPRTHA